MAKSYFIFEAKRAMPFGFLNHTTAFPTLKGLNLIMMFDSFRVGGSRRMGIPTRPSKHLPVALAPIAVESPKWAGLVRRADL